MSLHINSYNCDFNGYGTAGTLCCNRLSLASVRGHVYRFARPRYVPKSIFIYRLCFNVEFSPLECLLRLAGIVRETMYNLQAAHSELSKNFKHITIHQNRFKCLCVTVVPRNS